jgi:hypothetical protein
MTTGGANLLASDGETASDAEKLPVGTTRRALVIGREPADRSERPTRQPWLRFCLVTCGCLRVKGIR